MRARHMPPTPPNGDASRLGRGFPWRLLGGILSAAVLAATVEGPRGTVLLGADAPGQTQGQVPATSPARPVSAPPFATIEEGLALGDVEKGHYEVALERRKQLDESALTMWLDRVRRFPKLSADQVDDLDLPSVKNLLTSPRRYAGQAFRLNVYPRRVTKWDPGKGFTPTKWWTVQDGAIWRIGATNAEARDPDAEPIFILCPFDPAAVLGKPSQVGPQGELLYFRPRKCTLAGVFYKVYQDHDENGELRDYPVMMVWQIGPAEGGKSAVGAWWKYLLPFPALLILLIGFAFVRSKVRRNRLDRRGRARYHPLRDLSQGEAPENKSRAGTDESAAQIDPELKAAAEQYRKEKGIQSDAPDDHGGTR